MTGRSAASTARAAAVRLLLVLLLVLLLACASAHEPPPLLPGPAPPPCTIAREPALTVAAFRARFKGRAPVVFSAAASASSAAAASDAAAQLRARLSRAALLASHGGAAVTLASSNSFSHAKRAATLREYVERHVDAGVDAARSAEETWYLFGDTERSAHWDSLTRGYAPPLDAAGDEGLVVLGVGGRGSGVAFHTHGAAFGETILGAKQWFLSPPDRKPRFNGTVTQLRWALDRAAAASAAAAAVTPAGAAEDDVEAGDNGAVIECVVGEGEAIYVPPRWHHATLNHAAYNVFISTFTLEKDAIVVDVALDTQP